MQALEQRIQALTDGLRAAIERGDVLEIELQKLGDQQRNGEQVDAQLAVQLSKEQLKIQEVGLLGYHRAGSLGLMSFLY